VQLLRGNSGEQSAPGFMALIFFNDKKYLQYHHSWELPNFSVSKKFEVITHYFSNAFLDLNLSPSSVLINFPSLDKPAITD